MAVHSWYRWKQALVGCAGLALIAGCQSKKEISEGVDSEKAVVAEAGPDLGFLMTMNWEEAKGLSSQSLEVPPYYRLTADKIDVLKASPDGTARKVRARGKVFIEMKFAESGRVLCQEAYITGDEMILRGKPLMQRGGSAVSGLDDSTVFYMLGTRLRVIGRHQVSNESALIAEAQNAQEGGVRESKLAFGAPPILPVMSGPWAGGPNPLLPPLSSESVPVDIREKMRAEADAVNVMPLDLPNEVQAGPPTHLMTPPSPPTLVPNLETAPK